MPYDYLRNYFDWLVREPGTVWCILSSSQPGAGQEGNQRYGIVGYGRGQLSLRGPSTDNTMYARLDHYFSDRTHTNAAHPFNPGAMDQTGVEVIFDPSSRTVRVDLIAHSWGDARQSLRDLRIESGVLAGDGESVGNQTDSALFTLSFGTWLAA